LRADSAGSPGCHPLLLKYEDLLESMDCLEECVELETVSQTQKQCHLTKPKKNAYTCLDLKAMRRVRILLLDQFVDPIDLITDTFSVADSKK
jgi:hypothetical protein